jgi:hypothetical protein
MKIEALENIKSDGHILSTEDVKNVPDEIAIRWISAGWARDLSGTIPTGERKVLNAKLEIHDGAFNMKSQQIGESHG